MKLDVDIGTLESAAEHLEQIHRDYANEHKKIVQSLDSVEVIWKGVDAEITVEKIKSFEPQFKDLEKIITMYADFLRKCANEYERVDKKFYDKLSGV